MPTASHSRTPPGPDNGALIASAAQLRKAFTLLRRHPDPAAQARLQLRLAWIHEHNVRTFGWLTAETMRAVAFGDVMDELPTGEARESDFAAFLASERGAL